MALLKQSTAYTRMFLLVQSADHLTALTGATPTVNVSKAGGTFAAAGGTITEVANGFYKIALTTTDTNTLGDLAYHVTATSGDPTDFTDQVVAVDVGDATAFGLSRIDAAISSRMATFTLPTNFSAQSIDASGRVDVGKVTGTAQTARDLGASVLLSAGTGTGQLDFTSGVVKANLAQILGTALTETAGQLAGGFKQFFNIASPTSTMNTITTVTTTTTATNLTTNNDKTGYSLAANGVDAAQFTQAAADKVWSSATRALTDKAGFALSAAGVQAIWDALTSALTTVGSIGLRLVTDIDAAISSRNATAPPTTAAISTQVWSEALPGAFATGTAGKELGNLGAGADPWATAVPGAYASGTAGNILGNRLDVAVSTRATSSGAGGAGALTFTYTVYKPDGTTPLQDCEVWVSTDLAGNNVIAGTLNTNASGQVQFKFDAGTYYFWRHHAAYRFVDPQAEVVS